MKKNIIIGSILAITLVACNDTDELTQAQKFELLKMEKQHEHEETMGRINRQDQQQHVYSSTVSPSDRSDSGSFEAVENTDYSGESVGQHSDVRTSDSSGGSFLAGALAGAAAGYITSELLDDGWRSYTDSSGKTVYMDSKGVRKSSSEYSKHKASHPVKSVGRETKESLKKKASSAYSKTKSTAKNTYGKAKSVTKSGYNKAKSSEAGRKVRAATKRTSRKAKRVASRVTKRKGRK